MQWPRSRKARAIWRRLLIVQRSGCSGSPRCVGATIRSRSSIRRGSASSSGLRPAPARRTRPFCAAPPASSSSPRPMVLRAIPVMRDTAAIPPQPAANASLVAKTRRCRSSRYGPSVSNRRRIAVSLITNLHTAQTSAAQLLHVEHSDSIIVLRPLTTAAFLVDGCPGAGFGLVFGHAAGLVAVRNVVRLALLLVGGFRFVAARHAAAALPVPSRLPTHDPRRRFR